MTPPTPVDLKYLTDFSRLDALYRADILDSPPEPAFDRLVQLVAKLLHVPVAAISFISADRHVFKSQVGLGDARELPMSHSICSIVVSQRESLVADSTHPHAAVAANPAVSELGIHAYAGMPINAPDGETVGSFCAIDLQPRVWTQDELEVLENLAQLVQRELLLREQIRKLQESEAARAEAQDELLLAYAAVVNTGTPRQ